MCAIETEGSIPLRSGWWSPSITVRCTIHHRRRSVHAWWWARRARRASHATTEMGRNVSRARLSSKAVGVLRLLQRQTIHVELISHDG